MKKMSPDNEDDQNKVEECIKKANSFFKNFMVAVAKNTHELYVLSYELRCQDKADDEYTKFFISLIHDKVDEFIQNIIYSNKYDTNSQSVVVAEGS